MTMDLREIRRALHVNDVALEIAAIERDGVGPPIVFLHGFGSTKADYADISRRPEFDGRPFLAYDAPGCGDTQCAELGAIDIPFLVQTARLMVERSGFEKFHLVGHSMGGLTAFMLAEAAPTQVLSYVNIEGNIAPEDCFLSRQIIEYADDNADRFFDRFIARMASHTGFASSLYAANLPKNVRAAAVRSIFSSMVALSDQPGLTDRFLALPCPKMFMYGDQNITLSYLRCISDAGVSLAEIPECGHFPMYSNPPAMWRAISDFITHVETSAAV